MSHLSVVLRDYQTQAIADIENAFRGGAWAVLLVLSTGAGKTVIYSYITLRANDRAKSVLILAHRKELIRQGSNKLRDLGVPHGIIAPWAKRTSHSVQIGSIQTVVNRTDLPQYDLIIIDEAHHAVAPQYVKILASQLRAKVLGVTATPERRDGKGLGVKAGGCFDAMVVGPSIADLIAQTHLCPIRYFGPGEAATRDRTEDKTRAGDYKTEQIESEMNVPTITGDAVAHYKRHCDGKPAIVFCVSVEHAQTVALAFRSTGYRAVCGHGGLTADARDAAIAGLGDGRVQVLTTCDLVSEGVDVPVVECVILLRPSKSLGLILQQIGRGLRPAAGKSALIVLDHAGCYMTHGMPDDPREWTLEGKKDKGKPPAMVRCPVCFAVQKPARVCIACASELQAPKATGAPKNVRELEHVAGELEEITQAKMEHITRGRLSEFMTGRETEAELKLIAKLRNYKSGWVKHQLNAQRLQGIEIRRLGGA